MAITDDKFKAPLGVKAAANYFGVGTDTFSVCAASKINMWAKHKPIALSSMGLSDTPASLTAAQKKAANYGLVYKTAYASSKSQLPDKIAEVCGDNGMWTYTKPTAGTDWARLDDFLNPEGYDTKVGYNQDSVAPCESTELTTTQYEINTPKDITVTFCDGLTADSIGQLRLDQLGIYDSVLGRSYLCLAVKSGSEWYYIFSEQPLADMVTWTDSTPMAEVPLVTNPLFTPFADITEGGSKSVSVRLFLIDLYGAFDGSVPDSYKGGCISQTSIAAKAYNLYSLPLADMTQTEAVFKMYWDASTSSLVYGYEASVGSSTTTVTITVTNATSSAATIKDMFVYLMADFTFNYGGAEAEVDAALTEWTDSGGKETGGINASGTFGTGVYAAYGAAALGGGAIAAGETKTYRITFPGIADAFGYSYENPVIYCCANDTKNGRKVY